MEDLKQKLQSELEIAPWEMIHPHYLRNCVYYVKAPNDLIQVGILAADNKAHLIKGFLDAGELYKPSEDEVSKWSNDKNFKFKFLIIQPFVFIQLV